MGDTDINPHQPGQWTVDNNNDTYNVPHNGQNVIDDDNAHCKTSNILSGNECNERVYSGTLNEPHLSDLTTETESKLTVCDKVNANVECSVNNRSLLNENTDLPSKETQLTKEDKHDWKDKQDTDTPCSSSHITEDEIEDNQVFNCHIAGNNGRETQPFDQRQTLSGVSTNISDGHLTFVDKEDGLSKFFGKICGISQKKNFDDELEPYARNSFEIGKTSTAYGSTTIKENIGARFAGSVDRFVPPGSKPENEDDDPSIPWNNEAANTYDVSNENETERKRLYYKEVDTRIAVSPICRPEGTNNNASKGVSHVTAHVPGITHRHNDDDDCYDFSHTKRGYMVLVVNDNFSRSPYRNGAIWDLGKMKKIGEKFGFCSLQYEIKERNLTKPELSDVLLHAQRTDHSECDCFLLMISTHGLEQPNAQVGGKTDHALVCADDQLIFTSSILEMFNDTNCPSLKGKPKLFLIQACRGEQLDHGHILHVAHSKYEDKTCSATHPGDTQRWHESFDNYDTHRDDDSWGMNQRSQPDPSLSTRSTKRPHPRFYVPNVSREQGKQALIDVHGTRPINLASSRNIQKIYAPKPHAIAETPSLKCDNDMLVMYAIPPGMFAWRNGKNGSWMIDDLHKVLMSHDLRNPKSFLNLLTQVNWLMSTRVTRTPNPDTDGKTAISVIEHKLCKDVLFDLKLPLSY